MNTLTVDAQCCIIEIVTGITAHNNSKYCLLEGKVEIAMQCSCVLMIVELTSIICSCGISSKPSYGSSICPFIPGLKDQKFGENPGIHSSKSAR